MTDSVKQKKNMGSCFRNTLTSMDQYAVPVSLTLDKQEKFKTVPGGLLSIVSRLGIMIYFWLLLPYVVDKKKEVIFKTVKVNLENDVDPYILSEENFDVGVRITTLVGPLSDEMLYNRSRYFKIEASTQRFYQTLVGSQMINTLDTVQHELGPCGGDRFGNLTAETTALGITGIDWVCPKSINTSLSGSPVTLLRTTFRVRIVPCNKASISYIPDDNVTCASDAEIEKAIQGHFVQFVLLKAYFDENEFEGSPVKQEVSSTIFNIDQDTAYFKITELQRVNITTKDSWMSSQVDNKDYSYFEMIDTFPPITGYPKPGVHDMLTLMFTKYDKDISVVRQVVSLSDIISQCGGFASFIVFVSFQASKLFQPALYKRALTKRIFKIQHYYPADQDKNSKNNMSSSKIDLEKSSETVMGPYNEKFTSLWKLISSRKPPDINYLGMKASLCFSSLLCSRRGKSLKDIQKKLVAYNDQINDSLDIGQVVESIHKTKVLVHLLLSRYQRAIIPYLGVNMLEDAQPFINSKKKRNQFQEHLTLPSNLNNEDMQIAQQSLKKMMENSIKNRKDRVLLEFLSDGLLLPAESPIKNKVIRNRDEPISQEPEFSSKKFQKLELESFEMSNNDLESPVTKVYKKKVDSKKKKSSKIKRTDTMRRLKNTITNDFETSQRNQ